MAKRATQVVVETAYRGAPAARATQAVVETAYAGTPVLRASQVVIEVAYVVGGAPSAAGSFRAQVIG
jgi:hypothetical protein